MSPSSLSNILQCLEDETTAATVPPPGAVQWNRPRTLIFTSTWSAFAATHLWSLLFLQVSLQSQTALFAWTSGRGRRRGFWCQSHGRLWGARRERAGLPRCWNPRPTPADPKGETLPRASGETKGAYRRRQRQSSLVRGRGKGNANYIYSLSKAFVLSFHILCAIRATNHQPIIKMTIICPNAERISISAYDVMCEWV